MSLQLAVAVPVAASLAVVSPVELAAVSLVAAVFPVAERRRRT